MAIGDGVSALATLGVTFGGFSPTAMDGVEASKQYIELAQAIQAERKLQDKRNREREFARTSSPKTYEDISGVVWTYVVVDQKVVRIVSCTAEVPCLVIPESIDGMPVYALAPDACSRNDYLESIICPDSIESIGSCAFRYCQNLRTMRFPKALTRYSSTWLSHCPNLEEIILPDQLETIDLSIFDSPSLRRLSIGNTTRVIEPGAFQNTKLDSITIDCENPFIFTDGIGIYSKDGSSLLAIARNVSSYTVLDGCKVISKKAAYGLGCLEHISCPDTLRVLGEFAFSHSGIRDFIAPSNLEVIEEKAFYHCDDLAAVTLNEGLLSIGNSAFEESGLVSLKIPGTIRSIGRSITYHTSIVHSGPESTIAIDESSKLLHLDGEGGLYRHEDDGSHLIQLIDRGVEKFSVQEGTAVIDEYAFAHNNVIKKVTVPSSVHEIRKSAFRCCTKLEEVILADSVRSIGEDAFLDTGLTSFRVPASLEELGTNALVTSGAHHGDQRPSLRSITVAPGNSTFYYVSGMLCRRVGDKSNIVIFDSSAEQVVFPDEIDVVESYAFNNARGISYLEINPGLRLIETSGLTTWCWIEHIHIKLSEPVEGRLVYDFHFPNTMKGIHGISIGIGGASWVNVPGIMAQYDNTVVHAHDYNSPKNPDSIPIYDQVKLIMERLNDPVLLTDVNRGMFERLLRNYIEEICVDVARHDDRELMGYLVDKGFVNAGNIEAIVIAISRLQDAAMTGYLLEVKRRRFNRQVHDFDL